MTLGQAHVTFFHSARALADPSPLCRKPLAEAKVNNSGLITLGYTQALRPGVKASFGLQLDTVKLGQSGQSEKPVTPAEASKVGVSFTFES